MVESNTVRDGQPLYIEVRVKISFKTNFIFHYLNENLEEKSVELFGDSYTREIFFKQQKFNFFCMLFVMNNNESGKGAYAEITLFKNGKKIKQKTYHISNSLPYDGWFIFEKKIKQR